MDLLRVISSGEPGIAPAPPRPHRRQRLRQGPLWLAVASTLIFASIVVWWLANADTREIQALPDDRRIPLYHRTMDNLKNICDPAAPRSLRAFCHQEAELVLRFRECDSSAACQELARRHLPQPRR